MSQRPKTPQIESSAASPTLLGMGISAGIFVFLAATAFFISGTFDPQAEVDSVRTAPPPPPPPKLDTPPEPEKKQEKPELREQRQPPDLSQLDLAFGPSLGGVGRGMALPSFDVETDLSEMIFDFDEVEDKPVRIGGPVPAHPQDMKRRNIGARVVVQFVVTRDGDVRDPFVEESTNPAFNANVLTAVRRWKFQPGRIGGEAVNVRVRMPVEFPGRI